MNYTEEEAFEEQTSGLPQHNTYFYACNVVLYTLSLVLNTIVLVVIASTKRLQTPTNAFIASLATTDAIYAIGEGGFGAEALHSKITGEVNELSTSRSVLLSVVSYMYACSKISNYLHVIVIALEHWLYIVQPFLHQRLAQPKHILLLLAGIWLVSGLCGIDIIVNLRIVNSVTDAPIRFGIVYPCVHFLCSVLTGVIYTYIAVVGYAQMQVIRNLSKPQSLDEDKKKLRDFKRNWKCVKMIIILFGIFFVTLTPTIIFHSYLVYHDVAMTNIVRETLPLLAATHYCSNFFIYFILCRDFRVVLFRCWHRVKSKTSSRVSPSSIS